MIKKINILFLCEKLDYIQETINYCNENKLFNVEVINNQTISFKSSELLNWAHVIIGGLDHNKTFWFLRNKYTHQKMIIYTQNQYSSDLLPEFKKMIRNVDYLIVSDPYLHEYYHQTIGVPKDSIYVIYHSLPFTAKQENVRKNGFNIGVVTKQMTPIILKDVIGNFVELYNFDKRFKLYLNTPKNESILSFLNTNISNNNLLEEIMSNITFDIDQDIKEWCSSLDFTIFAKCDHSESDYILKSLIANSIPLLYLSNPLEHLVPVELSFDSFDGLFNYINNTNEKKVEVSSIVKKQYNKNINIEKWGTLIREVIRELKTEPSSTVQSKSSEKLYIDFQKENWYHNDNNVLLNFIKDKLLIESSLNEKEHQYIQYRATGNFNDPGTAYFENLNDTSVLLVNFSGEVNGEIDLQLFFIGYSEYDRVITESIDINNKKILHLPKGIKGGRIALRISGSGQFQVNRLEILVLNKNSNFESKIIEPDIPEKDSYLVLTNIYPSRKDLYRNGFVHRRVLLYKEKELNVDVFSLRPDGDSLGKYDHEGVEVYTGDSNALSQLLSNKKYKKILIHFVNEKMIQAIDKISSDTPLIVWIHGFETERWYRRWFNYKLNIKDILRIIKGLPADNKKIKFMRNLYTNVNRDIRFVFVSKWFKEKVSEVDTKCKVKRYDIVPNVVDEDLFNYIEKDIEQRKKILIIRPFASKKYANDLSVKAILELSKKDYFDELEFNIFGKGKLFQETLKPIMNFKNVNIHETFLTQLEIAELHKKHGIFLCPTRLDAQGVSMCEAMASGLIPVTNGVTAIPEFVSNDSGVLAPNNNFMGLALGIDFLYNNPSVFLKMSENASESIQLKSGKNVVISKEIDLILNK